MRPPDLTYLFARLRAPGVLGVGRADIAFSLGQVFWTVWKPCLGLCPWLAGCRVGSSRRLIPMGPGLQLLSPGLAALQNRAVLGDVCCLLLSAPGGV